MTPPGTGAAAVVLAGGSGTRVGASVNKAFLPLAGRRVVSWSFLHAARAARVAAIRRFVLVTREQDLPLAQQTLALEVPGVPVEVVVGGASRHGSEDAALAHLTPAIRAGEVDVVAIHDAARPLASPATWELVVATAREVGGAVPTLPATGLMALDGDGRPVPLDAGTHLLRVQTPQAFRAAALLDAYTLAGRDAFEGTDTASCVQEYGDRVGLAVRAVPGSRANIKVTWPHDVRAAELLMTAHLDELG